MLDEYVDAFSDYLRTGSEGALSGFCADGADLARLRVYRNGFLKSCIEALRASYPSVERIVGTERFPALARPYVETTPPRRASLVEYGEEFPRFIDDAREVHGLDYLASFAVLDRAWTEVYFAEDDGASGAAADEVVPAGGITPTRSVAAGDGMTSSGGIAEAGGVPLEAERSRTPDGGHAPTMAPARGSEKPEAHASAAGVSCDAEALMNLRGRLAPWVRLVSPEFRVLDAWSRLRRDALAQPTEVRHTAQRVLVWRSDADVLYRDLSRPEHAFIARVASGAPCGDAAVAALDIDPDFDLVTAFASLLHHRILTFGQ